MACIANLMEYATRKSRYKQCIIGGRGPLEEGTAQTCIIGESGEKGMFVEKWMHTSTSTPRDSQVTKLSARGAPDNLSYRHMTK